MPFQFNPFQIASSPQIGKIGEAMAPLDIIQNYNKPMRLYLNLFAIIFLAEAHMTRKGQVAYGGQGNEGGQAIDNTRIVGAAKISSYGDVASIESSEDKMSSNLRVVKDSTAIILPQLMIHRSNGNQQGSNQRTQQVGREQQDYHKHISDNHLRTLVLKEMTVQQQTQSIQPQNTFYLDYQYLGTATSSRNPIKLGTFEQQQTLNIGVQAQNSDNRQQNVKNRKIVNMGLVQKDDHRSRVRQIMTIRIEPDSQQQDDILRVYQELKMRRQKLLQHKISYLQGSLPKSKQTIKKTNQQQDIWLYCLIAVLSVVTAFPLLRSILKKQPQLELESTPVIKDDIPKGRACEYATPFSR